MLEKYCIANGRVEQANQGNILCYYNPSEDEKNTIIDKFTIDAHSLSSALDSDEVGRFEIENDGMVIIWKIPMVLKVNEFPDFSIIPIGFFVKNDKLIIISSDKNNYLNDKITSEIKSIYDVILFFQNNAIKHFIEHLKAIKLVSKDVQKKINTSMENEYLLQMFNLSEILVFYLEAINNNKVVLNKLKAYASKNSLDLNINFLNDIIIENDQASRQAEIYSQIFAGLMDARGTIINNNMNVLIKNLTIINIIFLPLNLIASMGGMSEFSMMTQSIPWPISYGAFSIALVILGYFTLWKLNRIARKQPK